jgi:predicted amidohydrolase
VRLALAQLEIEAAAVERNRSRAIEAIEAAAADGADLVALPELFNVGYFAFDTYARAAEGLDGPTLRTVAEAADTNDVAVLAGSIVEDLAESAAAGIDVPAAEGLTNAAVFLDSDGNRQAVYRKQHLFGYGSAEQELLTPGEELPTVDFAGFTVGIVTCYDLRFPGLSRAIGDADVSLLLVPSAWPYPRVEHWRLFSRTRAVENLCFLGAVNGVGEFDDATLLGRSGIYDPWGTTLASAGDDPATVTADLDPARVADTRSEFPALADRR